MKRGFVFSTTLLAAGLSALGAAGASFALHRNLAGQATLLFKTEQEAEARLASTIAGLHLFSDSELASLRARATRFRNGLGSPDSWSRAVRLFGAAWNAEAGERTEKAAYSLQPGVFYLAKPAIADWPSIVESVGAVEALPGAEIVAVEIRSSGDRERRTLDLVKVAIAVHARLGPDLP